MRCPSCGAEIPLRKATCPACGKPRPQLPPHFTEIENKFISLQNRYQAGEIDLTTYQAEVQKLVIQDHSGASWWLGGEAGQWQWYDGQKWVPRDPPSIDASPDVPTPPPKTPRAKRKIPWLLIVIPAALVLICLCLIVLNFTKTFDKVSQAVLVILPPTKTAQITEQEPSLMSQTATPTSAPTPITQTLVELSQQQQLLIDEFSWPDSFTILEADDEQGGHVRFETWIYYRGKITYTFFDGSFQVEGDVETLPDGFIPTPHHPDQFPLGASPDQIQALLPDHTLIPIENSEAIQPDAQMFAAQQLVLGFLDNRLFYVDALAFIPEGSEE